MPSRTTLALAVSLAAFGASAQTLYKLVDKNGKVTYTQEEPKGFDGTVTRIDVDPNANRATLPKYTPPAATPPAPEKTNDKARVATPQERLERAKRELANAIANPGPDDITRVGNVGGGTRPVPTEAYLKRLAALEQAVKDAEEEVRRGAR
jgi:hypothetical protein